MENSIGIDRLLKLRQIDKHRTQSLVNPFLCILNISHIEAIGSLGIPLFILHYTQTFIQNVYYNKSFI